MKPISESIGRRIVSLLKKKLAQTEDLRKAEKGFQRAFLVATVISFGEIK